MECSNGDWIYRRNLLFPLELLNMRLKENRYVLYVVASSSIIGVSTTMRLAVFKLTGITIRLRSAKSVLNDWGISFFDLKDVGLNPSRVFLVVVFCKRHVWNANECKEWLCAKFIRTTDYPLRKHQLSERELSAWRSKKGFYQARGL